MGATAAVLILDGPPWLAYACAAVAATAIDVTRPTMAALTPALCRTPEELTAANVVSGWNESISVLVAPALAGLLLAVAGPGLGLPGDGERSCSAAPLLVAADRAARQRIPRSGRERPAPSCSRDSRCRPRARGTTPRRAARRRSTSRSGCSTSSTSCSRSSTLGMGEGGAGYLNAAFGAGGALGDRRHGVARRAGAPDAGDHRRHSPSGRLAFAVMTVWSRPSRALLLLAVAGAARSLFDVAGPHAPAADGPRRRAGPRLRHARGADHGRDRGRGAARARPRQPRRRDGGDRRRRPACCPLLALLGGRRLLALDASAHVPVVEIGLLRSLRLFSALPPPELEGLARSLEPLAGDGRDGDRHPGRGGRPLLRDRGGRARGRRRRRARQRARPRRRLRRDRAAARRAAHGDGSALTDVKLYALEKEPFLEVLTGHPAAIEPATAIAAERRIWEACEPADADGRYRASM